MKNRETYTDSEYCIIKKPEYERFHIGEDVTISLKSGKEVFGRVMDVVRAGIYLFKDDGKKRYVKFEEIKNIGAPAPIITRRMLELDNKKLQQEVEALRKQAASYQLAAEGPAEVLNNQAHMLAFLAGKLAVDGAFTFDDQEYKAFTERYYATGEDADGKTTIRIVEKQVDDGSDTIAEGNHTGEEVHSPKTE